MQQRTHSIESDLGNFDLGNFDLGNLPPPGPTPARARTPHSDEIYRVEANPSAREAPQRDLARAEKNRMGLRRDNPVTIGECSIGGQVDSTGISLCPTGSGGTVRIGRRF